MIEFIKSEVFVIVLTIVSLTCTTQPMWLVLVASLLVVLFCVRSLSDGDEMVCAKHPYEPDYEWCDSCGYTIMWWVQVALSLIFCLVAGNAYAYLIFCELNSKKFKWDNVFSPMAVYVAVTWVSGKEWNAIYVFNALVLLFVAVALCWIQWCVEKYMIARGKVDDMVKMTAVRELYERKLNRELMVKNYLADKNARLEERENISRNIHNSVGHSITAAIMTLDAADMIYDANPELARERMHVAKDRIKGSLESIRHAVRVLDKETESVNVADFEKMLVAVADEFAMDTSIKIRTTFTKISESVQIPHEHSEFLTGALQELLTNGVKHGGADVFDVQVLSDSGHIRMSVKDNGNSGLSDGNKDVKIENGYGLRKIDSYIKRCGGETMVSVGDGFRYEMTLPIIDSTETEGGKG